MILSHKHRFIFIKTQKSAGTSMEIALSALCGADDVITPISPEDELAFRPTRGPRNYLRGDNERTLRADGIWKPSRGSDFHNHMSASKVLALVGEKIWTAYFKFGFVRNPWDRQVSLYHYHQYKRREKAPFVDWLLTATPLPCWEMITLKGAVALDFVGRYESLQFDFGEAMRLIGAPAPALPKAKADIRPNRHYREYYDNSSRENVANAYSLEIGAFGYRF